MMPALFNSFLGKLQKDVDTTIKLRKCKMTAGNGCYKYKEEKGGAWKRFRTNETRRIEELLGR